MKRSMGYERASALGLLAGSVALAIAGEINASNSPLFEPSPLEAIVRVILGVIMIFVGALPSVIVFTLVMEFLERRFAWAQNLLIWMIAAFVTGFPAACVLWGLLNMGDPAPGAEKHSDVIPLWAGSAAAIFGGAIARLIRRPELQSGTKASDG